MRNLIISATIAATFSISSAQADTLKFEAVWSSGSGSNIVTKPLTRAAFIKRGEKLTSEGLRLIDVETAVLNGKRKYAGLWIGGSGTNLFDGPMATGKFTKEMKKKQKKGLRLVDFEIIKKPNGGRQYIGVWRPGSGTEILTGRMQRKAFWARGTKLTKKGLRLVDVEVERVNGKVMYSGLFQTGTGTNLITPPLRRKNFTKKRDEFVAKNIELIDVERIRIGGTNRFVGVWATGSGESRLSVPRTFNKFVAFGVEQTQKGFRTNDMELRLNKTGGGNPPSVPPVDPNPPGGTPDFPELPQGVNLVGGNILTIDFRLQDGLVQLDLPHDFLPSWLPRIDGGVLLPDAYCGLNLLRAGAIFWQIPGNDAVNQFPFNSTEQVSNLGSDFHLGGVEFGGPIGACAGPTEPWAFPEPFLKPNPPFFEPLPNMTLRVQFDESDSEIRFKANGTPNGATLTARQLYKPATYAKLVQLLELHDPSGPNTDYCDGTDDYFAEVCDQTPSECPVNPGPPPNC